MLQLIDAQIFKKLRNVEIVGEHLQASLGILVAARDNISKTSKNKRIFATIFIKQAAKISSNLI